MHLSILYLHQGVQPCRALLAVFLRQRGEPRNIRTHARCFHEERLRLEWFRRVLQVLHVCGIRQRGGGCDWA